VAESDVKICNMALSRAGVSNFIEDLGEKSEEAAACDLVYATLRDLVLREFPWGFAKTYQTLALVEESPVSGWSYSYRRPSDCLKIHMIAQSARQSDMISPIPYDIGSDDSGQLIYTDINPATLKYTRRVENTTLFTPDFDSALAWRITADISLPRSRIKGMSEKAMSMYMLELGRAAAHSANEQQADPDPESEFIRARY